jgi:hypothetical protein
VAPALNPQWFTKAWDCRVVSRSGGAQASFRLATRVRGRGDPPHPARRSDMGCQKGSSFSVRASPAPIGAGGSPANAVLYCDAKRTQRASRAGPPDGLIEWPRLNPSVASGDQAPRKAVSLEVTNPTLTMPFVPANHDRRPPRRE